MSNLIVRHGVTGKLEYVIGESERLRRASEFFPTGPSGHVAELASPRGHGGADFELKETHEGFFFTTALPRENMAGISITLTGNLLTISGARWVEREESDDYALYECSYAPFTRPFTLPDGVDSNHIHAELKDGVLTVSIPKAPMGLPRWMITAMNGSSH